MVEAYLSLGNAFKDQGKLDEAVDCCRQALELKPDFVEAQFNLANALRDLGRLDEAVACYRRALELKPNLPEAHSNLGSVLKNQGHLDEAVAYHRRALHLKPDYAEAHSNLGNALQAQGKMDEAIACYRRALDLKPTFAEAHFNLGIALKEQGKLDEAVACYRCALQLNPNYAEAHNNLGAALSDQGKLDEALACYRRAVELKPDHAEAHSNLGNVLKDQGKLDEAVACHRRALDLKPDYAEGHINLGNVLRDQGHLDEAVASHRRALLIRPDYAEGYSNLGAVFKDQGRLDEAVACWRRALDLKPDFVVAHSNLVYSQLFSPDYDAQAIYEEHRRWSQQFAEPLRKLILPHANLPSPDRRLRIGYVSPDFRVHPVGRFLLPLLEAHDHGGFEIFCYSSATMADAVTTCCQSCADTWRQVFNLSDQQLANTIRLDQIDILVDLSMHMAGNRLLVFARKPAPVQVTYLAYCGTTGLDTMDYRLTDSYLDPPGQDESCYTEQSIRLPETYWCYQPVVKAPPVNNLPALRTGQVTFGCLNNHCKVTAPTLAVWSRLLQALPEARLVLHARQGSHRQRVVEFFASQHIEADRVEFMDLLPPAEYFQTYQRLDIGLDPFPCGGGTTTCDALWMGVPVVSLAGKTAVGRGGRSLLSNIGLADLVANDAENYVRIAVTLAQDQQRLADLRTTLRDRMQASPLMDGARFARHVEAAYRDMWRRWCEGI
jgi:predicted O-linked N-acetylglucosamine transferase (SPINDLY family)